MFSRIRSLRQLAPRRRRSLGLILEELEIRLAPAVFNVMPTPVDGTSGSLRNAIEQADSNSDASNTINLAAGTYQLADTTDGSLLIRDQPPAECPARC